MEGVRKLARSQSVKVSEMLKLPPKVERSISDSKVEEQRNERKETNEKCNGAALPATGLICYSDLLQLLSCPSCSHMVSPPVSQCRKGHLYCRDCRTNNSCRICKQTFLDAPNIALEKIITLIALPCTYGPQGCPSSVFLPTRLQHETVCQYRPVNCQFKTLGCQQVFSVKDICWHHRMCQYAHYNHSNVLPNMPPKNKSSSQTAEISSDHKPGVTFACDDGVSVAAADPLHTDTDNSDNSDKCDGETAEGAETQWS